VARSAKLRSLAKLNLDLRVLYKRPDNFHELRTVFQTVSLADILELEYQPARRTQIRGDVIVGGQKVEIANNLVERATQAVLDATKATARVSFRLHKSIPMGAGLGGGSSNAAAVLLALPVLARKIISPDQLHKIAVELGSDVPFFLNGGGALALGSGTEMYPFADIKAEWALLAIPPVHTSTAEAYAKLSKTLTAARLSPKINDFRHFVESLVDQRSAKAAADFSANDFEAVVFAQEPLLGRLHRRLQRVAKSARMTGSGSALFAVFESKDQCERARQSIAEEKVFRNCRLLAASLVSRTQYWRLWRRQLGEHLPSNNSLWPLFNRYAR